MKAVNLIPSEHLSTARSAAAGVPVVEGGSRPLGAYAILGVLAFAVIAMALIATTKNGIADKKQELAKLERTATVVEGQAAQLKSYADFKTLADARMSTVKAVADARFPWARTLDDVSRVLPGDAYISSLDGSTSGEVTDGSTLRTAIAAPSIEINGCTRSQSGVARMMSKLRNVRGVTRVTLAKSEKPDTATPADAAPAPAAAAADGSTPTTAVLPCPKGSPPAFDVIVFFERAAVNPAAAPNAGAAGVTGPTGPSGSATGPTGAAGASSGATTPASATTTP